MREDFKLVIQKDFEEILKYSQSYSFDLNAENLIDQWEKAKMPFIKAFGDRTVWRSERPVKVTLNELDKERLFHSFLNDIENRYLRNKKDLFDFLKENKESFFENKVIKPFPKYKIQSGSKILKSLKHFFDPIADSFILETIQNIGSTYIQQDKIEGYLYLSVDPRDFLTLSDNNAKWRTCHALDGDYRAGNLSYMVDETTLIAYIANGNIEHFSCLPKDAAWYSKKWRMLVHTNLSTNIYYNKQYPFKNQHLLNMVERSVQQLLFDKKMEFKDPMDIGFKTVNLSDCRGPSRLLERTGLYIEGLIYNPYDIIKMNNYLGFNDLIYSNSYTPIVSVDYKKYYRDLSFLVGDEGNHNYNDEKVHELFDISISDNVLCPCCGKNYLSTSTLLICDSCAREHDAEEDLYIHCVDCGKHLYEEDEKIKINGETYCSVCGKMYEEEL